MDQTSKEKNDAITSSTSKGLLHLPQELRDAIYRYIMVSDGPIKMQCGYDRDTGLYHFTMIPDLTLVSRQLRAETLRIFFKENEFEMTPEMFNRNSVAPLRTIRTMHKEIGLESPTTLRVSYEVKKKTLESQLCLLKANLTLSNVEGRIAIVREEYGSEYIGRRTTYLPSSYRIPSKVCGCRIQKFALAFNKHYARSKLRDVVLFVQRAQKHPHWSFGYPFAEMSSTEEVLTAHFCENCRGYMV